MCTQLVPVSAQRPLLDKVQQWCGGHTQQPTALVPTATDVDIAQLTAAVSARRKLLCGMDRFVLTSLLQIYKKMYRGKNLEHRLRFDIGIIMFMTLVYRSLVHRVGLHFISRRVSPTVSHTHASPADRHRIIHVTHCLDYKYVMYALCVHAFLHKLIAYTVNTRYDINRIVSWMYTESVGVRKHYGGRGEVTRLPRGTPCHRRRSLL